MATDFKFQNPCFLPYIDPGFDGTWITIKAKAIEHQTAFANSGSGGIVYKPYADTYEWKFLAPESVQQSVVHVWEPWETVASKLAGAVLVVVIMTFNVERRGVFEEISRLQHRYEDIISTTLHNHMRGSCLEVILTRGDIARVRELAQRLKTIRGIEVVRVTVA